MAQTKDYLDSSTVDTLRQFDLLDAHHKDLEEKAAGVLIFPTVTKGGVALANEYGQGVLKVNGIAKGYYSLAGASVGITAGMASHSEVILFMTPAALGAFLRSKGWSLGAEAGVAVTYKARRTALTLKASASRSSSSYSTKPGSLPISLSKAPRSRRSASDFRCRVGHGAPYFSLLGSYHTASIL